MFVSVYVYMCYIIPVRVLNFSLLLIYEKPARNCTCYKILIYFLREDVPTSLGLLRKQEKERKVFVHFWLDGRWYRQMYQLENSWLFLVGWGRCTYQTRLVENVGESEEGVCAFFLVGGEVVQKFLKNDLRNLGYRLCVDFNIDFSAEIRVDFHFLCSTKHSPHVQI